MKLNKDQLERLRNLEGDIYWAWQSLHEFNEEIHNSCYANNSKKPKAKSKSPLVAKVENFINGGH